MSPSLRIESVSRGRAVLTLCLLGTAMVLFASSGCAFETRSEEYACETTADCNGGRTCRGGWCVLDDCAGKADGAACDDSLFCTLVDTCLAGECVGVTDPCTDNGCASGTCEEDTDSCSGGIEPDGTACEDGFDCTTADTCNAGVCVGGSAPDCTAMDGPCSMGTCDEVVGGCIATDLPDGTTCDDGLICTEGDVCTAGVCAGPTPMDCSGLDAACVVGVCDEAMAGCIASPAMDGDPCDDGMFCNSGETCTSGACGGGMPTDCTAVEDGCNGSMCNEMTDACDPVPVMDGTGCDDSVFCTIGDSCTAGVCGGMANPCDDGNVCTADSCDLMTDSCANDPTAANGTMCDDGVSCTGMDICGAGTCAGMNSCMADAYTCTTELCDSIADMCVNSRDETLCAGNEVCNPVAYPGGASGCGEAPAALALSCPSTTAGMASMCSISLTTMGGTGVPGEAGNMACVATPGPLVLFSDSFTSGSFDPAWNVVAGAPVVGPIGGGMNDAAEAVAVSSWTSELTFNVSTLSVVCVDFDIAQANANNLERIRWHAVLDGGAATTIFDLDFNVWENDETMHAFNRNVCVDVSGATTLDLQLQIDAGIELVWVDNVVVSGIGTAFVNPPGGAPDNFDDLSAWTIVSGSPTVGMFAGSNVFWAQQVTNVVERVVDASMCDVLDVDFDFGFNNPNGGEVIQLLVSVDGGPFNSVELLNIGGTWNTNGAILSWFGLRRVTDMFPNAAGSSNVVFRLSLAATGGGRRVYVDNFEVLCADLPDPTVSMIVDAGGGLYDVDVNSSVPATVAVTCDWATSDDGPLSDADNAIFTP